ncbi:phosphate ABC transporter permease PtsA [Mycolicibacterium moriokaense]|nr:phosphate ABC transporter permease PtsA [Mycolicibacterium moriokaense]
MTDTTLDTPVKGPTFHAISQSRKIKNRVAEALFASAFLIAMVPLVWVLYTVASRGYTAVITSDWWGKSLSGVLPEQMAGGVYHAIYGTIIQAAIAALLAVPLGIMSAVYLVEYGRGWFARTTTFMVDILAGVPSIVAALFIFALWIATMGFPQSALAVSLALVLLMLPVVVRNTEEMLKLVPDELREASYALGVPKWKTIARVVVPTALPGIISGILLALARVIGETAPVLVLVGYARSINYDPLEGNMASLPLLIYTELINPEEAGRLRVWGAALTLILIVAGLYIAAAFVIRFLNRNRT